MSGAGETGDPWWGEDQAPHDPDRSGAQIDGLRWLLRGGRRHVLDLGCGAGRIVVPLVEDGHDLVAVDREARALVRCRRRLREAGGAAKLVHADFRRSAALPAGPFDAVLCLGNTFMTLDDVDDAVDVLTQARRRLARHGVFVMDDCPADFWPELTGGNWLSGVSADGRTQLVWVESDAVFALRRGDAVEPDGWRVKPGERRLRLWTDGALRLAARAAGLSAPERLERFHLLFMGRGRSR